MAGRPSFTVSQSNVVIIMLLLGFIVFVTVKGELPSYLGAVGLSSAMSSASGATNNGSTTPTTVLEH